MYVTIGDLRPMRDGAWVLMAGCNWKCPYCFERDILDKDLCKKNSKCKVVHVQELVEAILKSGAKLVKIDGGEPTVQDRELEMMCQYLKSQNVGVQLCTNGSRPEIVGDLLTKGLVDWVTVDVKAPLDNEELYKRMTGGKGSPQPVRETIDIARDKAQVFEINYPVIPGENDKKEYLTKLAKDLYYCGVFTVRGFDKRRPIVSDEWYKTKQVIPHAKLKELAVAARDAFNSVDTVRFISHEGEEEV